MPILVAGNRLKKNNKYYEQKIHNLIINDVERYRLIKSGKDGNKLVYAKGKINLDYCNSFLDSNNQSHNILDNFPESPSFPKTLFAFYDDGFYTKYTNNNFYKFNYQSLSDIINSIPSIVYRPITFDGWYLSKTGRTKINSIKDIADYTDLFKYSSNSSLPEITLYARWNIPTVRLYVHNITKKGATSSAILYETGERTQNPVIDSFNITFLTDVSQYINKKIGELKYISWANNKLDGTGSETALRNGPQKFMGWAITNLNTTNIPLGFAPLNNYYWQKGYAYQEFDGNGSVFSWTGYAYKNSIKQIHAIPCFEVLAIWPKLKIISNKKPYTLGGIYKIYNNYSSVHLGSIKSDSPFEPPGWSWKIEKGDTGEVEGKKEIVYINTNTDINWIRLCYSSTVVFVLRRW